MGRLVARCIWPLAQMIKPQAHRKGRLQTSPLPWLLLPARWTGRRMSSSCSPPAMATLCRALPIVTGKMPRA